MGMAEFIANKFINQTICVSIGNDAETLTYSEYWTANREFFEGIVRSIEHEILELDVEDVGKIWISCSEITAIWKPEFNYHLAIRATVTGKPKGGRK